MNGKLIFTFDDSDERLYRIYNILKSENVQATFYIIAGRISKPEQLTWDQLREMSNMDLQNHTYNHISLPTLIDSSVLQEISITEELFIINRLNKPNHLAYPYGAFDDRIVELLKDKVKSARTIEMNTEFNRMKLPAVNIDNLKGSGLSKIKNDINKINKDDGILILFSHGFITKKDIQLIIRYAQHKGVNITTINELYLN